MSDDRLPQHIAIVMDGNGRWAKSRHMPRISGHRAGAKAIQKVIKHCGKRGIKALSIFAFSSENWGRPQKEVDALMKLFLETLRKETDQLAKHKVRMRIIGDRSRFSQDLQREIIIAEQKTAHNTDLNLTIAANYSGRWDITQAMQRIAQDQIAPEKIDETVIARYLSLADLPDPDLFIRTGGELRISNFFLWQTAYCELYFSDLMWPQFDEQEIDKALEFFATRERRFGLTHEQVKEDTTC